MDTNQHKVCNLLWKDDITPINISSDKQTFSHIEAMFVYDILSKKPSIHYSQNAIISKHVIIYPTGDIKILFP